MNSGKITRIRYFSDLHIDVNQHHPPHVPDADVFTVVAGDVSGYPDKSIAWIREHVRRGIVVAGNHIVYNSFRGNTLEDIKKKFAEAFPPGGSVVFLDGAGTMSVVVDGIRFIGTTLYTDYAYVNSKSDPRGGAERVVDNQRDALFGLNDFHMPAAVHPRDYLRMFVRDYDRIRGIVKENEKLPNPLPVVIVTHHCPSPQFIAPRYRKSSLNASFVSDLEPFIETHGSIKAWIAGHVHSQLVGKTGSGCRLLANPYGYEWEDCAKRWTSEMYLVPGTWEVEHRAEQGVSVVSHLRGK